MNKNPRKTRLMIIGLTVFAGIIAAVALHQHTWFEFRPTRAEIPMTAELQANSTTSGSDNHSLAIDEEGNTVVVWTHHNGTDQDVYFRLFDIKGAPLGAETIATSTTGGDQFSPSVAKDEKGNFIIAFVGYNTVSGSYDIFARAFQPNGTPIGNDVLINSTTTGDSNQPKVALDYNGPANASRFVVSWTHNNGIDLDTYYRLFNVDFTQTITAPTAHSAETILHTGYSGNQHNGNVAMNNLGQFIVTAQHSPGSGNSVLYRIFAQNGTALTALTEITTGDYLIDEPAVAADKKARSTLNDTEDIRFILTYRKQHSTQITYNIASQIITCTDPDTTNSDDNDITCSLSSPKILDTRDSSINKSSPSVDADYLGNFTVTWVDGTIDGNNSGIAAQSYNYRGQKIGDYFQVNGTITAGPQTGAKIAMNTDGFYDISFFDFNNNNLYFKKYVNEIFKVGNEKLAHTADNVNTQSTVATAISPTHNQIIVWMDYGTSPASLKYTLQQINQTDPANPSINILKNEQVIATGNNINNPDVDFFKDDTNCNRFIVVWENDLGAGNGKDIFYNIFDSSGTAEYVTPQVITSTSDPETKPTVAAGIYNNGITDVKIFSVAWINGFARTAETKYHSNGTFYSAIVGSDCVGDNCKVLNNVKNSLNPDNNRVIFSFDSWEVTDMGGSGKVFVRQFNAQTAVGNPVIVYPSGTFNKQSDIAFINSDKFAIVYSDENSNLLGSIYQFDDQINNTPDLLEDFTVSQSYVSQNRNDILPRISGFPTSNPSLQQFLVIWNLSFDNFDKHIVGQFIDYTGTYVKPFGPTFRINSSRISDTHLPAVGYNRYGLGIVAWEGESATDSWGVQYQLLQNPSAGDDLAPLEPVCRQVITAGGLTMSAPSSISFPPVSVSATETKIQQISIRDETFGGDVKYVEVQDATGINFTLSILVSDFTAEADDKIYLKANEHFQIKNWDESIQDTNDNCNSENPLNCFLTENSSYNPTAFSLTPETQNFTFADTQKVMATKTDTQQNEIGRWKIYPEFWIKVPPIIPAGQHEATITFTLVN